MDKLTSIYKRHRFPPEIIQHTVWLYHRFNLSARDIEDLMAERGIAINPKRQDLLDSLAGSDLPIRPIEEIQAEVESLCGGKPQKPKLTDDPVAVIKWVDGTLIDSVFRVDG